MKRARMALIVFILSPTLSYGGTANLAWKDNSTNEDGFIVEKRQAAQPGSYVEVARTAANTITYTETVTPGASICYQVKAFNRGGSSAPSNEICGTVPTLPTIPPAPDQTTLQFIAVEITSPQSETPQTQGDMSQPQGE